VTDNLRKKKKKTSWYTIISTAPDSWATWASQDSMFFAKFGVLYDLSRMIKATKDVLQSKISGYGGVTLSDGDLRPSK
jgi:hypothetical protein